jgi:hypothetical protein
LHSIRVSIKIIISFLFSITVLLTFITISLFGVKAEDTVRLIVTEATGLQREMVVFYADLQPLMIHNVFWLCLAGFGFMLIFLYFIDHSFKGFLAPGILSLAITVFLAVMVAASYGSIQKFIGPSTDLYIQTAVDRFRQAAYAMFVFGIALVALSRWGDKIFKRSKKTA